MTKYFCAHKILIRAWEIKTLKDFKREDLHKKAAGTNILHFFIFRFKLP